MRGLLSLGSSYYYQLAPFGDAEKGGEGRVAVWVRVEYTWSYKYFNHSLLEHMMELFEDSRGVDVLAFTAEEIGADWRKGMVRDAAMLITSHGTAEGVRVRAWGILDGFVEGSLAEHFYASLPTHLTGYYFLGTGTCEIVSVTDVQEVGMERYEHDSFGPGSTRQESGLTAVVTCEHGVSGVMSYATSVGDLIYAIAQAQVSAKY